MKISRFVILLVAIVSVAVDASAALGATHAATRTVTIKTGNSSLGRIIVDARGRTLYLFELRRKHLLQAGVRSQKTNPSRSTISPVSQAIGSAKIGPA